MSTITHHHPTWSNTVTPLPPLQACGVLNKESRRREPEIPLRSPISKSGSPAVTSICSAVVLFSDPRSRRQRYKGRRTDDTFGPPAELELRRSKVWRGRRRRSMGVVSIKIQTVSRPPGRREIDRSTQPGPGCLFIWRFILGGEQFFEQLRSM